MTNEWIEWIVERAREKFSCKYNASGCDKCNMLGCSDRYALNKIIEALEKQVPKKPEQDGHGYYCSCGNFIIWDNEEPNASDTYCGQCGQKQDLSEV